MLKVLSHNFNVALPRHRVIAYLDYYKSINCIVLVIVHMPQRQI